MDFNSAFEKVKDSLVQIRSGTSVGSGSIVATGKKILTCAHCIVAGQKINVYHPVSSKTVPAEVIAKDNNIDLAILEMENKVGSPISLSVELPRIGTAAFALGFPLNINDITLLPAIIASTPTNDTIRLNSSINHGNSGGPLINLSGKQVGVVNAKHGSLSAFLERMEGAGGGVTVNFGGFEPINAVKQLIKEMRSNLNLGIGYAIPIAKLQYMPKPFSDILT
jgi:S1-C subfamily serine protease